MVSGKDRSSVIEQAKVEVAVQYRPRVTSQYIATAIAHERVRFTVHDIARVIEQNRTRVKSQIRAKLTAFDRA
eukprot:15208919-Ditylum_brightwellii.AAC.1